MDSNRETVIGFAFSSETNCHAAKQKRAYDNNNNNNANLHTTVAVETAKCGHRFVEPRERNLRSLTENWFIMQRLIDWSLPALSAK